MLAVSFTIEDGGNKIEELTAAAAKMIKKDMGRARIAETDGNLTIRNGLKVGAICSGLFWS